MGRSWGLCLLAALGCDQLTTSEPERLAVCEGFGPWQQSPYVLPYSVGEAYLVTAGACDGGHVGQNRYGHDFSMPIGTPVAASRGGVVSEIAVGHLVIDHGDGTWGMYFHLSPNSASVAVGDSVAQGEPIAQSGDTGTSHPHLHFHLKPCGDHNCESIAVNYRNTDPNPLGVESDRFYTAFPY